MEALLMRGQTVAVHVGGIAEMFESHPDKEVIFLKRRRGFVKAAIQYGVPIIPMYHFGNSQIVHFGPRCALVACGMRVHACEK
jgi:diacylglycerol O-acyltransferase 2, plant